MKIGVPFLFLLIGATVACPSTSGVRLESLGAAEAGSGAYAVVLAQARDVVVQFWGRPEVWDSLCGTTSTQHRVVLALDPRLRTAADSFGPPRFGRRLAADSISAFIARGLIDRLCPPASSQMCGDTSATMNLSLSEVRSTRGDTTNITLLMSRSRHCPHDHEGFAAEVEFLLQREGTGWTVRGRRLVWIT